MIPQELYEQILENMPICCLDIIVYRNKKILLVRRKNKPAKDNWWVLGGRLLKREKLKEGVKRKVKEEAGIQIDEPEFVGVQEYFSKDSKFDNVRTGTHTIGLIFKCELKNNQEIKLDSTSSDFKWIDKIDEELDDYVKAALRNSRVFDY